MFCQLLSSNFFKACALLPASCLLSFRFLLLAYKQHLVQVESDLLKKVKLALEKLDALANSIIDQGLGE